MIFASSHSNFHLKLSSEEVDLNLLWETHKLLFHTLRASSAQWLWLNSTTCYECELPPKGPCVWILGSYVVRIWNCSRWGWNRGNSLLGLESYNQVICLASTFDSLLGVNVRNWLKVPAFQDQASPSCHLSYCDGQCSLWMWANIILSLQMLI